MGTYRYFFTENGPVLTEPSEEYKHISYEECLDFLKHLRARGRNLQKSSVKGIFNTFDFTKRDLEKLMIIKEAPDDETAYLRIAEYCSRKQPNCNHKLMPELENIYREDLYDYLVDNNIDNAEMLSELISRGEYKEYRKHNPKILPDNFDQWAKACNYLPSRNMFRKIFSIEYQLYINRKEYEDITKNIRQIFLWCENLEEFRIGKDDILEISLIDLFDKYSPSDIIIHNSPVKINNQIVQIKMKNMDVEAESGMQYDLYERLSIWNDVTSIELEYENGTKRELTVKWSDELTDETDGITDFYQRHIPEISNGQFTNVFTSSFIIEYWGIGKTEEPANSSEE